jgi:Protein of unknown function (DUF3305)
MNERRISIPIGVVVRKQPGVTRWAKWVWRPVGVLPGAKQADWHEMRREGEAVEYHAGTVDLELHRADTEAYVATLETEQPSVFVIMRPSDTPEFPWALYKVTASPFESQDHEDSGEELVAKIPMPPGLLSWVIDFVERHHEEEEFVKRQRRKTKTDLVEDGVGDSRISQATDVYRAPTSKRPRQ